MARCPNCGNWVYYMWVHYVECIKDSAQKKQRDDDRTVVLPALKGANDAE